jgi:leucyl aminopeptidase (aminopeptidase T)
MNDPRPASPEGDASVLGAVRMLQPNIDAGRSLVVVGSTDVSMDYYRALCAGAAAVGVGVTVGLMTPRAAPGQPIPRSLMTLALEADTVLFTGSASVAHSQTALDLLSAGRSIITFPVPAATDAGPDTGLEALAQLAIYDADKLHELKQRCDEVAAVLDNGSTVHVSARSGTDFTVSIAGRRTHSWYGVCDEDSHGITAWPPGEAHVSVVEESARGIVVVDGYVSGLGVPDEPIELEFSEGRVTRMRGTAASSLTHLLGVGGVGADVCCEIGIAVNPWLEPTGSNGDKNALGTWHFALGSNASACFGGTAFDGANHSGIHLDFVSRPATTITVDGAVLQVQKPARSN